ncbi:putative F-box/kelch-repeat protein At1g12870 [Salvia hispanica]|uniref:putative F-box/kelch-repeat protein At1g12870 n=1 Tax=Salvia hispanica TaxID=49212 RepID=UPI00200951F5|nr:putative F-box/kelch-repeat protein At1g12870 [Salvia hispanica]XP_047983528.1 putative F-box/kelch-repeat protein At1g12870 [Salvia hispanica]
MNIDVVFEILLHLPVRSLLRFIGVHKSWYYIINSPQFRKLHTLRRNNNKDEEVYLCFTPYFITGRTQVSLNLLDNGKLLMWYYFQHNDEGSKDVSVSRAVKGLVCMSSRYALDITICNPFLGQLRTLPLSSYATTHSRYIYDHHVGLGFHEDYKVVWLHPCWEHSCLHVNLYSARTNSWRELNCDQDLIIEKPIKSVCKNGSFAHWEGRNRSGEKIILSFDMKNEVFRTITISRLGDHVLDNYFWLHKVLVILAKDECSFVILVVDKYKLNVYESSGEGSELIWNNVNNVDLYSFWKCDFRGSDEIPFWRNDNCVIIRGRTSREVLLYDYRARKFIRQFMMLGSLATGDDIIEYEGSLISP